MHEHHAVEKVVKDIVKICQEKRIQNPAKIVIELGKLTTFKEHPFQFYFEHLKQNIPYLKNSTLIVKGIAGTVKCNGCGKVTEVDHAVLCPLCKSPNIQILSGRDIVIKEIITD